MISVLVKALFRKRGNRSADVFIRGTGAFAAIAIPFALWLPASIPLLWLILVGLPLTGPLSPLFPTGFEPVVMEVGTYCPPLLVAVAGSFVFAYMEILNWQVYKWVLARRSLAQLQEKPWLQRYIGLFARYPFAAVVFAAATPFPFWAVRILAIWKNYNFGRYVLALAIGRLPRTFFYAWLGEKLQVPTQWLLAAMLAGLVVALLLRAFNTRWARRGATAAPMPG